MSTPAVVGAAVAQGRRRNAGGLDPATLTGLTVDLRGDDPTIDFGFFFWPNTGTANQFETVTASEKPIAGAISGRQSIDFDGTSDRLFSSPISAVVTSTEWWSLIVVENDVTPPAPTGTFFNDTCIIGDAGGFWGVFASSSGYQAGQWDGGSKGSGWATPAGPGKVLIEAWYESGTLACRVNAGAPVTAAAGAITNLSNTTKLGLGHATSKFFNGDMGDIVVTSVMPSADQRLGVRQWMVDRWGVTA